jgi:hypothetical protein
MLKACQVLEVVAMQVFVSYVSNFVSSCNKGLYDNFGGYIRNNVKCWNLVPLYEKKKHYEFFG